jgi:hypothetical protein
MGRPTGAPHVLIVGGYLTEPVNYARVRRRLLERGAARVIVAPIHLPDWMAAAAFGFGALLLRAGRAVREARAAAGAPIVVVGHSAGGVCARLAMSPVPFEGRRASVAADVGCLVTLGTPHALVAPGARTRHRGHDAVDFLAAVTPGAWFEPTTAYLTVASSRVRATNLRPAGPFGRSMRRLFGTLVGPIPEAGSDGIVPVTAAHLEGARQLTFDDVLHGHIGGPWYGDGLIIDRWWPMAVELWRGALASRAASLPPAGTVDSLRAASRRPVTTAAPPG